MCMREVIHLRHKKSILVPTIISINALVFLGWQMSPSTGPFGPMADHFLVSWKALSEGRYWVLLASAFSHNMFWHLFINMYVLLSFGSFLERYLGRFRFLSFYLLAGIISSFSHAAVSQWILNEPRQPALGASGAIAGLILLFSLCFPKEKILLLGLIPISAIWGALAFIGLDLWGLMAQAKGGGLPIGHGAHLGGAFTGILFYWLYRPRKHV